MEDKRELKATLETLKKKDGGTYQCVVIKLTDNCDKKVFLDPAELELLNLSFSKDNNSKKDSKLPF